MEEYYIATGKFLDSEPITLSDFLRIKEYEIKAVLKANRNSCPFSFLNDCFENAPSVLKAKIFLLALDYNFSSLQKCY